MVSVYVCFAHARMSCATHGRLKDTCLFSFYLCSKSRFLINSRGSTWPAAWCTEETWPHLLQQADCIFVVERCLCKQFFHIGTHIRLRRVLSLIKQIVATGRGVTVVHQRFSRYSRFRIDCSYSLGHFWIQGTYRWSRIMRGSGRWIRRRGAKGRQCGCGYDQDQAHHPVRWLVPQRGPEVRRPC